MERQTRRRLTQVTVAGSLTLLAAGAAFGYHKGQETQADASATIDTLQGDLADLQPAKGTQLTPQQQDTASQTAGNVYERISFYQRIVDDEPLDSTMAGAGIVAGLEVLTAISVINGVRIVQGIRDIAQKRSTVAPPAS